jgi:Arabinose efflux permease
MNNAATKPLAALALVAFGIGTTEFVIMGLLPDVASDLGVTIPTAGLLVSGYALGVAFGGPLLALLTARLPSRRALFLLLGLFIAGNVGCALAPDYGWLMAARVLTAFCHAAFLGVGSVIAAGLVPPVKRAQAIALMIGGLSASATAGCCLSGPIRARRRRWSSTPTTRHSPSLAASALVGFTTVRHGRHGSEARPNEDGGGYDLRRPGPRL